MAAANVITSRGFQPSPPPSYKFSIYDTLTTMPCPPLVCMRHYPTLLLGRDTTTIEQGQCWQGSRLVSERLKYVVFTFIFAVFHSLMSVVDSRFTPLYAMQ